MHFDHLRLGNYVHSAVAPADAHQLPSFLWTPSQQLPRRRPPDQDHDQPTSHGRLVAGQFQEYYKYKTEWLGRI